MKLALAALSITAVTACGSAPRSSTTPAHGANPFTNGSGSDGGSSPEGGGDDARNVPVEQPAIECTPPPEGFGSATVPRAIYDTRIGASATKFSDVTTTAQRPLEGCGLDEVLDKLATLTCDDGTNPYGGDRPTAHRSRAGNMGPGGRCGSIVDLYEAPCPEATYAVYADMYFCPQ